MSGTKRASYIDSHRREFEMIKKSNVGFPGTLYAQHESHASSRSASPIAFFFVAVICFLFGVVSNSISEMDFSSTAPLPVQSFSVTTAMPQANLSRTEEKSEEIRKPLGLQWYQMGFDNPWQFSTMRTGIAELDKSFMHVLQRDGRLPRVVVSFTSLPKRFHKYARETVRLLKQQVFLPNQIYIAVPKSSRRSNDTFVIPSWVRKDGQITVLRPDVDFGPATKLIPTLDAEKKLGFHNTRVVTIDDDNEGHWSETSLLQLVAYSLHFEDAAIGYTGWNVTCMVSNARCDPEYSDVPERQFPDRQYNFIRPSDDYACHSLSDWLPEYYSNCLGAIRKNYVGFVDVLEGYRGVLYQPRFFDTNILKSLLDSSRVAPHFLLVDDVWFSGWLSVRNISRLVINPAIHHDAPVRLKMVAYSKQRNLSTTMIPLSKEDNRSSNVPGETEAGLHDMGQDFVKANHDGVRWFEQHKAWTPGLWDGPAQTTLTGEGQHQNP